MRNNPPLTGALKKYLNSFSILRKELMLPNLETFSPFTEILISYQKEDLFRGYLVLFPNRIWSKKFTEQKKFLSKILHSLKKIKTCCNWFLLSNLHKLSVSISWAFLFIPYLLLDFPISSMAGTWQWQFMASWQVHGC